MPVDGLVPERRDEGSLLLQIAHGLAPDETGTALYGALTRRLCDLLQASFAVVGVLLPEGLRVRTVAGWGPQGPVEDFEYDLAGTPCAHTIQRKPCIFPDRVFEQFPQDAMLGELGVRGYGGAPLLDSTGAPLGVLVALFREPMGDPELVDAVLRIFALRAATDLERTSFRERLLAREENLRNLVRSCPMGVHEYAVDSAGRLVFVAANPAADRLTGIDSSGLVGLPLVEAFPGLVGTEIPERYLEAAIHGRAWEVQSFGYDHEAVRGTFDVYAFQSSPGRLAVMFLEVSDRLNAERALRQSQKMEAMGQLAGGVAHDFNNLLQAVQGYTELALQDLPPDHPSARSLGQVVRAAGRGTSLTGRLLAFSRQDVPMPRPLDLEPLVGEVAQLLERVLGGRVELSVRFEPGLKPVLADPGQVEQVLFNLCINARDAMAEGGRILVTLGPLQAEEAASAGVEPGDWVVLEVKDTGPGIPESVRARLFEPFFTTKEKGRGSGLGLPTVQAIVETLGGCIRVDSVPGEGATFRLYLPATEAGTAPAEEEHPAGPGDLRAAGLLVVGEDDDLLRHLTAEVLARAGGTVLRASTGTQALDALLAHGEEVALAILDVGMPGMNGLEVRARLRQAGLRTPILFTGGHQVEQDALDEPMELLAKPYSPAQLVDRVGSMLEASSDRRRGRGNPRRSVEAPEVVAGRNLESPLEVHPS